MKLHEIKLENRFVETPVYEYLTKMRDLSNVLMVSNIEVTEND